MKNKEYEGEERRVRTDWHQTKNVSITIIVLLLTNIVSTVWWAATLTGDVDRIMKKPELVERVIRLEAITEAHNLYLSRLSHTLDKVDANMDRIDKEQARRASIVNAAEAYMGK